MYRRNSKEPNTEVYVQLDKINPIFKIITVKKVVLKDSGDEQTAFRFVLDKDGEVKEINQLPISLIRRGNSRP